MLVVVAGWDVCGSANLGSSGGASVVKCAGLIVAGLVGVAVTGFGAGGFSRLEALNFVTIEFWKVCGCSKGVIMITDRKNGAELGGCPTKISACCETGVWLCHARSTNVQKNRSPPAWSGQLPLVWQGLITLLAILRQSEEQAQAQNSVFE